MAEHRDVVADILQVSNEWPDGIHTCEELQRLEPGRRPCTCGRCPPVLTPSADLPACRDDDPACPATLAACYPDPPEYQHPDGDPQ